MEELQFKTILQLFNHKNNSTCTFCIAYNEIIFPQTYLYVQASIQNIEDVHSFKFRKEHISKELKLVTYIQNEELIKITQF